MAINKAGHNQVPTGIYKVPVAGPLAVGTLGVAGDVIADLRVHGGPRKAVYAYPSEHYAFWRDLYPGREMPWGWLGENLTTVGLDETALRVGDRLRIGSALVAVTQPREPCYKLAHKFGTPSVVKQMWESGNPTADEGLPVMLAWSYLETGRVTEAAPLLRWNPSLSAAGLTPSAVS